MITDINKLISPRLLEVIKFIEDKDTLDVGSDHAYLPIYLKNNGFKSKIYASENKIGPFNNLKKSIKFFNMENFITTILADGLDNLVDVKQLVFTGMGGYLIANILLNGQKFNWDNKVENIVIEPQKDLYVVKKLLIDTFNFHEVNGKYISEKGHIYPILVFKKGKEQVSELDLHFSSTALKNNDKILFEYLEKKEKELDSINSNFPSNKTIKNLEIVKEALKKYGR